jgi:hypothetical protein
MLYLLPSFHVKIDAERIGGGKRSVNESSKGCFGPEVVRQIHNDGLRSAANNHPLKRLFG